METNEYELKELIRQTRLKRETQEWEARNQPGFVLLMAVVAVLFTDFKILPIITKTPFPVSMILFTALVAITCGMGRLARKPATILAAEKEIEAGGY